MILLLQTVLQAPVTSDNYISEYIFVENKNKKIRVHKLYINYFIYQLHGLDMYFKIKSLTPKGLIQLPHNAGIFSYNPGQIVWNRGLAWADMQT